MNVSMLIFVNFLTMIRIIGVFCIVPIFLKLGGVAAAILSIGCYLTDWVDGILARKCHVSTFFGSFFDGAADKAFTIANLIVLFTITKLAIIPILCEIAIITIQAIKFQKNVNVQSSMVGKIKTWIISITVILIYLVIDIEKLSFLGNDFVKMVMNVNRQDLLLVMFVPLFVFEFLTVFSYLKFLKGYVPGKEVKIPKVDIHLLPATSFKNKWKNFCTLWLNHDFYVKYKDSAGLKNIRKTIKSNR